MTPSTTVAFPRLILRERFGELAYATVEFTDSSGRPRRIEFDVKSVSTESNGILSVREFSTADNAERAAALAIAAANERAERLAAAQRPSIAYRLPGGRVVVDNREAAGRPGICPLAYGPRSAMEIFANSQNSI